ncbi:MAG: hypothetical protein V3W41_17720 [Planctomycetota bacterium]
MGTDHAVDSSSEATLLRLGTEDDDRLEALRSKLEASGAELAKRIAKKVASSRRFMTARVLSFSIAVLFFFVTASTGKEFWAYAVMLPALLMFIGLVVRHGPVKKDLARLRRLARLVADKTARLDSEDRGAPAEDKLESVAKGILSPTAPTCPSWELPAHVLEDLGIFEGRTRLFALVDTAPSRLGRLVLADWLRHPSLDANEIRQRQLAVEILGQDELLREKLEQDLAEIRGLPSAAQLEFLSQHPLDPGGNPGPIKVGIASFLAVGGFVAGQLLSFWPLTLLGLVAVIIGHRLFREGLQKTAEIREGLTELSGVWQVVLTARSRLGEYLQQQPEATSLKSIQQRLDDFCHPAGSSLESLPKQLKRLRWLGLYRAGLVYVFFNFLTFYDLFFLFPLAAFFREHRARAQAAIRALGELEALISMANLRQEQRGYREPVILERETPKLEIDDGLHPYLSSGAAVGNSVSLHSKGPLLIITGSNMAGKSTFLKMVGLNSILAQIGASTRATSAHMTPLSLSSDINVRDSLDDGQSYFAVEVDRIREMIEQVADEPFSLLLLDEMFRGTNTHEKVAAGIEVTRHLAATGALSLVATHDHEFTELELAEPALGIRNFHFNEDLEDGGMVFHYHLNRGPAVSRNAIRVLEAKGFPRDLVQRALERSLRHD